MMMEGDIATFIANLTPVIYKKTYWRFEAKLTR